MQIGVLGKWLIFAGTVLVVAGLLVLFLGKWIRLGHLPLDFSFQHGRFSFYFPLGTALLLSIILSLLLNIFLRIKR